MIRDDSLPGILTPAAEKTSRLFCVNNLHMLLFQAFQQPLIGNGLGGNNASQLSEISEEIDAHDMKFAFIQQGVNLPGGPSAA